ncbi:MAG: ABC transporter permease [Phycisphaerales bacterium]|nr:MAG: ABC transporter permease [Phycisphaerales bacterium]
MADLHASGAGIVRSQALGVRRFVGGAGIYIVVLLLLLVGSLVSRDFLTSENILNIVRPVTLLGIVAVGLMFVTQGGHYVDLSIPATMALSGMVAVSTLGFGIAGSVVCGLGAGLLVGLINGFLIGYLRLNPIIWTLAMNFMLDGLLRWSTGGNQVYPDYATGAGDVFVQLSRFEVAGMPGITLLLVVLAVVAHVLTRYTCFGDQLQLTGSAYDVAATSGVAVRRVVLLSFLISSFTTAAAGILLASLGKQGTFTNGQGYDFNAVTAVVIGGVALTGGVGTVCGVVGGVLVMGLLGNIMTLAGWGSFDQMIAKGLLFVIVVGAMACAARRGGRDDE